VRAVITAVLLALLQAWGQQCLASCSAAQAKQAEELSTSLADWTSVYDAFVKFKGCDDGGVAEGYSDTVGRLLAEDWNDLEALAGLARQHPSFKKFVLRHIDETLSQDRLVKIRSLAERNCPAADKSLCRQIAKATE
jgi:hypothetical protein